MDGSVKIANGNNVQVNGEGKVVLKLRIFDGEMHDIIEVTLNDVLYIPE